MSEEQVKALLRQVLPYLKVKKRQTELLLEEQVKGFQNQARQFRVFGRILCVHGETFQKKLNGAIAYGLAEVCEMLAEAARAESPRGGEGVE